MNKSLYHNQEAMCLTASYTYTHHNNEDVRQDRCKKASNEIHEDSEQIHVRIEPEDVLLDNQWSNE